MKFFLDTAVTEEIKEFSDLGLIDGVTTNPSLIKKSGRDFFEVIKEICELLPYGDISAEVIANDFKNIMLEADKLRNISENVVIKLPMTVDGIKACNKLSEEGTKTNVTLCFSANQAILAAKAGATYVSPFVGRLDDTGHDGMELIGDICNIFDNYPEFTTQVLVASIRNPQHIHQSAVIGADVVTSPVSVIRQLFNHPLTDKGLASFMSDWKDTKQTII